MNRGGERWSAPVPALDVEPWELAPMPADQRSKIKQHAADMYAAGRRDQLAELRHQLAHHATPADDPCADRGVGWPCDVAEALGVDQ